MIDQLAQQILGDIKQTLSHGRERTDGANAEPSASQIKSIIESGLRKLNLVSREEFDAQQAVLKRTREKLDQLELVVAEMEKGAN